MTLSHEDTHEYARKLVEEYELDFDPLEVVEFFEDDNLSDYEISAILTNVQRHASLIYDR